jgi:hypothetical protein
MPYPYLAAKENAYNDCSHDSVLHHGVSAFANRANAKPISMRLTEVTPNGYKVRCVHVLTSGVLCECVGVLLQACVTDPLTDSRRDLAAVDVPL